jgi:hypothetical protein
MKFKDKLFLFIIAISTIIIPLALLLIPNYLRTSNPNNILEFWPSLIIFVLFNIIFIGIPAGIHRIYLNDYSKIKSVWFFALFGGITGALLGEFGNLFMIIPYAILMFIYAQFYKRFAWWKVALTSYLAGIIIENAINRAPLQVTTLMWIAFFIYPYFATKIWENRKKVPLSQIIEDFKFSFAFSVILTILAVYFSRNNISPPLIVLGATLPFIISIIYKILKRKRDSNKT